MDTFILSKRNQQQINKLNQVIDDYEQKLDHTVDQVVSQLLNHSKKISDPLILPEIVNSHKTTSHSIYTAKKAHPKKDQRNRSLTFHSELMIHTNQNYENQYETLKSNFKKIELSKLKEVHPSGRAVGAQKIVKPKLIRKKPEILPAAIRNNPFSEKNAIKSYELDKGILSLIQKGKIGKDVNIITAFEKGRPMLQANKAIFHNGEERFAELETEKINGPTPSLTLNQRQNLEERSFNENWALTMPRESQYHNYQDNPKEISENKLKIFPQVSEIDFSNSVYIKILHYSVVENQPYQNLKRRYLEDFSDLKQIFKQIVKLSKKYGLDLIYVDSKRIIKLVTFTRRISEKELQNCIVKAKEVKTFSLKNIKNDFQKKIISIDLIKSSIRCNFERKIFLKYLKKKTIKNNIYQWALNNRMVRKIKEQIKERRIKNEVEFASLQRVLKQRWRQVQQKKHYQIHLVNQNLRGKQSYKQILNTQLTRIFNLSNINTFIIYILPYELDADTINYYYKIMELEEIPNYRERVTFLTLEDLFHSSIPLAGRLYYNTSAIKSLKKKIQDYNAYFSISYPSKIDILLSTFLKVPIFAGNLLQLHKLELRTEIENIFKITHLDHYKIQPSKTNLTTIADQIKRYCESIKRCSKFIIKINHCHQSSGIALLTFPFTSLPEMYTNTVLIIGGIKTVDEYYHLLVKNGGIVEKYSENVQAVTVVSCLGSDGESTVIGTFDRISNGFVTIAYTFPQKTIDHRVLISNNSAVLKKLVEMNHFGHVQTTFYVDELNHVYLEKVQTYFTNIGSSLFYFKFLADGYINNVGDFMAKIVDTFEIQNKEEEVINLEPRCFCYIPYLLHFGLSERQVSSFFQLCRMGGVSFDLENKYGATFILLGALKSSLGLIATAKDSKTNLKIMLKSLDFLIKQNSHNMSNEVLKQKEIRMRERQNILNVKERLEELQ